MTTVPHWNTDGAVLTRSPTDTLDFRKEGWGHKIHTSTFRQIEVKKTLMDKLLRRQPRKRVSFIAHSSHYPIVGQKVIWTGEHGDVEGVLYEYDLMHNNNPKDQFKLYVEIA